MSNSIHKDYYSMLKSWKDIILQDYREKELAKAGLELGEYTQMCLAGCWKDYSIGVPVNEIDPVNIKTEDKEEEEKENHIPIRSAKDILEGDIPEISWRVDKLLPNGGIGYIAGPPGLGKSFFSLYMAQCVASGKPVLGLNTQKGKVLYLDGENGEICAYNRIKSISEGMGIKPEELSNLQYSVFPNLLFNRKNIGFNMLRELIDDYKPDLLIFDSLVRFMTGSENDAESCKDVFDSLRSVLREHPNLSILILHHVSKLNNGGLNALRGSSEIAAAASSIFVLTKGKRGCLNLTLVKSRWVDLNNEEPIAYQMKGEEDIKFEEKEYEDTEISAIERAKDSFLDWVANKDLVSFSSKEAETNLMQKGYGKKTIYELLKVLQNEGSIKKLRRGFYEVVRNGLSTEEWVDETK